MNAHDPSTARGGWTRWLGLVTTRRPDVEGSTDLQEPLAETPAEKRRRHMLEDISSFLIQHHLPVSPGTLGVAHDVVTGANPTLTRLIADHIATGEPITIEWLEEAAQLDEEEGGAQQVHTLIRKLEAAIAQFGSTATAARTATSDYNDALTAQVDELDCSQQPPCGNASAVHALTCLAREMLRRTRDIERELSRSEHETHVLQKQLEEARREAEIDHLTGLPNRRAFEAVFKEEYTDANERGDPLCVAFCDIDRFKRINDTHGHDAGDRVLREVAQSLAALSNDKCHVARHGGEEFVVLLRGVDLEQACSVLDETREKLAARRLMNRSTNAPFGRISFSAGVADVHAYPNRRDALRAADEALFRAKLAGRNRVLAAGQNDWTGFRVIPGSSNSANQG